MEALLVSLFVVGIAEVGDKSLFLAILLSIRQPRPWPIFWGLLVGGGLNLALAAFLGTRLALVVDAPWMPWILGGVFLAMALWALLPEHPADARPVSRGGVFLTAAVGFFLVEMADKTQLATLALAARYESFLPVMLGAVGGLLLVNVPGIWLGHRFAARLPLETLRRCAAGLFTILGGWILLEAAGFLV